MSLDGFPTPRERWRQDVAERGLLAALVVRDCAVAGWREKPESRAHRGPVTAARRGAEGKPLPGFGACGAQPQFGVHLSDVDG